MAIMKKLLGFASVSVSAGALLLLRRYWAPKSDTPQNAPNPIFRLLNAPREAFILKAAVELRIFTHIEELGGKATIQDLVRICKASERGMTILLNALVEAGYLKRSKSGIYENTNVSLTNLVESSDQYVGNAVLFYLDMNMLGKWSVFKKSVIEDGYSSKDATDAFNPMWINFAKGMAPIMVPLANRMAKIADLDPSKKVQILDVAAGHGIFGITFAKHYPLAEVTGQDWEQVLEVAKSNAKKHGVQDRYHTLPGSFFKVDLGKSKYDLVLIPNFVHHFGFDENVEILKRAFEALKSGGRVMIADMEVDEEGIKGAVTFRAVMLAVTQKGDVYTKRQFIEMCEKAGFVGTKVHSKPGESSVVVATKP